MSCSKPLPPFVCDSLYYLDRDQLEHFLIVCRPLKNFIDRYLHTKPYRVFDQLSICGGSYSLSHNHVRWHPCDDDYSAQQFLAGHLLTGPYHGYCYPFDEMRLFLGQSVRIKRTWIAVGITYIPEHIEAMESVAHLWCDRKICVSKGVSKIVAEDFQLILDSPTILQCRYLYMSRAEFSFKDYKLLYSAKIIDNYYYNNKTDSDYWAQFLEQPGMKPPVVLIYLHHESIDNLLDHLSKAFSSAVSPNAFKIVFAQNDKPLTEFRKTNETGIEERTSN